MDLNDMKKDVVTREFEWQTYCSEKCYAISDTFTISLEEIHTKW